MDRPPPGVPASPRFPEIETGHPRLLERRRHLPGVHRRSREGRDEWVFYDGPPFANGLPHYGHLLTGYAKDLFPRFQTMRGKQVHRRFGWDTHGLPAELEAMRQLGITEKHEIEDMGIDVFNAKARESVLEYTQRVAGVRHPQARWVDFENDYKTLDITFMESVLWAFKQLYDKGLAYEGFRVLPYCWHDETPLSNHELRMDDDVYKMRQDQSVTVTFPLDGAKAEALGLTAVRALAWTTTPWTLPTNLALAVGPDIEYAVVPSGPLGASDGAAEGAAEYLLAHRHGRRVRERSRLRNCRGCDRGGVPHRSGTRARGRALRAALGLLRRHREVGHRERLADPGRRLRRDRRGHGHRAPGARLRRGRPGWCVPPRASRSSSRSTTAQGSCPTVRATSRGCRSSRPTSR